MTAAEPAGAPGPLRPGPAAVPGPDPVPGLDLVSGPDAVPGLDAAAALGPGLDADAVLRALLHRAGTDQATNIGYPGATDIDYSPVLPFFTRLWNNVGDPGRDPGGAAHTKPLERAVVTWFADLFGLPADDRWGYVTSGGTEGNLAGLHAARARHPRAVAYYSAAAHYSIPKILDMLGVSAVRIDADRRGALDPAHLSRLVAQRRHRPAIVVATAGTTMTEAVDDVAAVDAALRAHGVTRRHVHLDAALSGIPLALDGALDLVRDRVDSVAVSGHKFLGTPIPSGIVLMRRSIRAPGQHVSYVNTADTTVTGSRCGQAALLLWHAVATLGHDGLRTRVRRSRELAAYAVRRLSALGWPAWRHPHAFTVVLATPPPAVTDRWTLASEAGWSHLICVPGVTRRQVDAFTADLAAATRPARAVPLRAFTRRVVVAPAPARAG